MYIWRRSSLDPTEREAIYNAVHDEVVKAIGMGYGYGALYWHGDVVMEVNHHPDIGADEVSALVASPLAEEYLLGGGAAIPATWQPVVEEAP